MFDELRHKISKDTVLLEKAYSFEDGRNTLKDKFPNIKAAYENTEFSSIEMI